MATDNREPRFFIDHGMIHDLVSGKHVTCETEEDAFGGLHIEETCELLNKLNDEASQLSGVVGERDRKIRQLQELLVRYGDRVRMAKAEPAERQSLIDEAFDAALNNTGGQSDGHI